MARQSHFFVVEGLDASGKSTQIELLLDDLSGRGLAFQYLHFPRTGDSFHGDLIARYLRGEFGPVDSVHPYLVAMIFAGDRYEAAGMIREWLAQDRIVITDRYVISNIAFQCAKLENPQERTALKQWILRLEYEHYGIPRPDLSLFLDVPFPFIRDKLSGSRTGGDRDYLMGNADIHEQDLQLQKRVRQMYLQMVGEDPSLVRVDCRNAAGEMQSPDQIFARIRKLLFPEINNPKKQKRP